MMEKVLSLFNAIPDDKVRHALGGAFISSLSCAFALLLHRPSFVACLIAMLIVSSVAAIKEIYDHFYPPHECSLWDWLATVIGGLIPLIPILIYR